MIITIESITDKKTNIDAMAVFIASMHSFMADESVCILSFREENSKYSLSKYTLPNQQAQEHSSNQKDLLLNSFDIAANNDITSLLTQINIEKTLSRELLLSYVTNLRTGDVKLDILNGSNNFTKGYISSHTDELIQLMQILNKVYQYVFIAINPYDDDFNSLLSKYIDKRVILIEQNNNYSIPIHLQRDKHPQLYTIMDYEKNSLWKARKIKKHYEAKSLFTIPHNVRLRDYLFNGNIITFAAQNAVIDKNMDTDSINLINEITKLITSIRGKKIPQNKEIQEELFELKSLGIPNVEKPELQEYNSENTNNEQEEQDEEIIEDTTNQIYKIYELDENDDIEEEDSNEEYEYDNIEDEYDNIEDEDSNIEGLYSEKIQEGFEELENQEEYTADIPYSDLDEIPNDKEETVWTNTDEYKDFIDTVKQQEEELHNLSEDTDNEDPVKQEFNDDKSDDNMPPTEETNAEEIKTAISAKENDIFINDTFNEDLNPELLDEEDFELPKVNGSMEDIDNQSGMEDQIDEDDIDMEDQIDEDDIECYIDEDDIKDYIDECIEEENDTEYHINETNETNTQPESEVFITNSNISADIDKDITANEDILAQEDTYNEECNEEKQVSNNDIIHDNSNNNGVYNDYNDTDDYSGNTDDYTDNPEDIEINNTENGEQEIDLRAVFIKAIKHQSV